MTDVGRRFRATRTTHFEFELTEDDVSDQLDAGETALESAYIIAGSTPDSEWVVVGLEIEEL